MSTSRPLPSVWSMILWPVLISLIVIVVRLAGELAGLGAPWFSAEGGGGAAVVGVSWLIPIFGFWFGWRLTGAGYAPDRPGLSFLLHTAAFIVGAGALVLGVAVLKLSPPLILALGAGGLVVAAVLCFKAWPQLARTTLAYGLSVRIAVIAVTVVALWAGWDTHFVKGPEDFGDAPFADRLLTLATPQLTVWITTTMGAGGVFATAASMIRGRRADDDPDWD